MRKTLRVITITEYAKWYDNCKTKCNGCIFENVKCNPFYPSCWIYHRELYSKEFLKQKIKIKDKVKKPKLTEVEKIILKHFLDENYKYVARDEFGKLFLYFSKPHKSFKMWLSKSNTKELCFDMLKFIKWSDEEPYLIEDLLKE